ncbi:hypothetical protein [Vibrio alfacsensis]|nr:hypothetical protein [Vibrio alfacsensis]
MYNAPCVTDRLASCLSVRVNGHVATEKEMRQSNERETNIERIDKVYV